MSFPNNIKKEHILKAIERIDSGDVPPHSSSVFYDLEYNSKLYSPKLVVSFANSFVNGVDLDRNSFHGGPGKPAFKLLEKEGFKIVEKVKIPKIKLYDFHGDSALKNAERLLSIDKKWFYWDDGNFKKYIKGDVVFWVNRKTKEAFFTLVDEVEIRPVFEDGKNYIRENGIEVYAYAQDATRYENFYRFKVLQIVKFSDDWNYADPKVFQNQLMSYILYENGVNDVEKRISKINDLLSLFTEDEANTVLANAKELLTEEDMPNSNDLIPEILDALNDQQIISELAETDFKFEFGQQALKSLQDFKPTDPKLFEKLQIQFNGLKGVKFMPFLDSFIVGSEEYELITRIGILISYCDVNAANKKTFNQYEDKRTLAKAGVRQYAWLKWLLQYKIENNSLTNLPPSIKHALLYLSNPINGSTMLSERHRALFCNVFLSGKEYNPDTFISDYLAFFEPYNIKAKVTNLLNYTNILDRILYRVQNVRDLWIDNQQLGSSVEKINKKYNIYDSFKADSNSVGLIFSESLILRYITSLYTKPFVILTGLSGSGKTKLAQSFSMWLCSEDIQYSIVPVGADWTNREPLLGYPNSLIEGHYVSPESGVLDLILSAIDNYNTYKEEKGEKEDISNCNPYFLILDEMNLSHVERYFSDFLSAMESGDEIKLYSGSDRVSSKGVLVPSSFKLPPNFFIIGTVNIDETTYMFSPKVLDRANTIEFRIEDSDLAEFIKSDIKLDLDKIKTFNGSLFEVEFLTMSTKQRSVLDPNINEIFKDFFNILKTAGGEFGYRTLKEMSILINFILDTFDKKKDKDQKGINNAIDVAIMQKLLPKLHGSRSKMVKILPALCRLCVDLPDAEVKVKLDSFVNGSLEDVSFVKFKLSFNKICRMYKNAIENGFTSYAEA